MKNLRILKKNASDENAKGAVHWLYRPKYPQVPLKIGTFGYLDAAADKEVACFCLEQRLSSTPSSASSSHYVAQALQIKAQGEAERLIKG